MRFLFSTDTKKEAQEQVKKQKKKQKQALKDYSHRKSPAANYPHGIHPALVPGIAIEDQKVAYKLDKVGVFVTGSLIVGFIVWGLVSTDSLAAVSGAMVGWITSKMGWLFLILAAVAIIYMIWIAVSRYGSIPLGRDDEAPEYSTASWVAMLFAAGMGIGLVFWGTAEPMNYFMQPPPGSGVEAGSPQAAIVAMAQSMLHWCLTPWSFYAIVGVAIAYSAYRRGRAPLMSRIFIPLLGHKMAEGGVGRIIDMLTIATTVFGTASSLGMGALQIVRGLELVSGWGKLGNGALIAVISVLTAFFVASALSGISRGIKYLSSINMAIATILAVFIFFVGPSVFILDLIPSTTMTYLAELPTMLSHSHANGPGWAEFVDGWTIFYWAWWLSWSPFVGMFIARISRGRTIRQFIFTVLLVPSVVTIVWFSIFAGTAMNFQMNGKDVYRDGTTEDMLFNLLHYLPLTGVISMAAMICLGIFFITSADSASIVMGSLSQQGKPNPNRFLVAFWGLCVSGIAIVGMTIGGETAIAGMQNIVIATALPFAIIMVGILIAFYRDLSYDPYTIRNKFAKSALSKAVKGGLRQYGDDFNIAVTPAKEGEGAGAAFDSTAPEVTEWYQRTDEEGNPVDYDYDRQAYLDDEGNPIVDDDESDMP